MTLLAVLMMILAQSEPVFRSGVSLVRVDAQAVDANGRVVEGLKPDDFRVLDEGVPQTLVNFSFAVEPLDLILLFDTSGGMHDKILSIVRAAELGFNELRRTDRVSVRAFGKYSAEFLPFTDDLSAVNVSILSQVIRNFGGTGKFETAADEAALRFGKEAKTHRKRGVLIITGKAGVKEANEAAIVRDFWGSDAILSELILGPNGGNAVVDETGGATIAATTDLGTAFRDSVHYLRSGYTMYYALPDASTGAEHRLQVELTPEAANRLPNVRIRARSGYIAK